MTYLCQLLFGLLLSTISAQGAALLTPRTNSYPITPDQIIKFAPKSVACNATAPFAEECRTAEQSAPFINRAFQQYGIESKGEKAAIVSLMAFETGDFKFNINHFPGRAGQGTRNLMMFPFVLEYAYATPSVANQAKMIMMGKSADDASLSNDTKNAVRALVLGDDLSFASAMWFYKAEGSDGKGCARDGNIVSGLQSESRDGWEAYITKCIGTTVTDDRATVWQNAINALW